MVDVMDGQTDPQDTPDFCMEYLEHLYYRRTKDTPLLPGIQLYEIGLH